MIFQWQTPKIACNNNVHLALKGLENFLCDGEHLPSTRNSKLAAGIFPPWSLTRQDDWLAKTRWDIAHAIPCV